MDIERCNNILFEFLRQPRLQKCILSPHGYSVPYHKPDFETFLFSGCRALFFGVTEAQYFQFKNRLEFFRFLFAAIFRQCIKMDIFQIVSGAFERLPQKYFR